MIDLVKRLSPQAGRLRMSGPGARLAVTTRTGLTFLRSWIFNPPEESEDLPKAWHEETPDALQVHTVDCSDTELAVALKDGRRISVPLWWLPRLLEATPALRAAWRVMPFGDTVEWREIDEHVSVKGLLRGKPAPDAQPPGREL